MSKQPYFYFGNKDTYVHLKDRYGDETSPDRPAIEMAYFCKVNCEDIVALASYYHLIEDISLTKCKFPTEEMNALNHCIIDLREFANLRTLVLDFFSVLEPVRDGDELYEVYVLIMAGNGAVEGYLYEENQKVIKRLPNASELGILEKLNVVKVFCARPLSRVSLKKQNSRMKVYGEEEYNRFVGNSI